MALQVDTTLLNLNEYLMYVAKALRFFRKWKTAMPKPCLSFSKKLQKAQQ
jgi:hypothetical protein